MENVEKQAVQLRREKRLKRTKHQHCMSERSNFYWLVGRRQLPGGRADQEDLQGCGDHHVE